MTIPEEKEALRKSVSARIARMSDQQRRRESDEICRKILQILPEGKFEICGYMPLKDEVDVVPLLRELLQRRCALYLPLYTESGLVFHSVSSLEEDLHPGKFTISVPHPQLPPLDPAVLRFALVPGRAFNLIGRRLGRGKGAYDTWIAQQRILNSQTQFFGIAFRDQIVDEIPEDPYDQRVDRIITSSEISATA